MAVTSLQLTYTEILGQLGMVLPLDRTSGNWTTDQAADVARCIRSGLRKFYYPQAQGPGESPWRWSFLRPKATLTTTTPYSTGTVTVVDGVVTGSGTTFPTWAADAWFVCNGRYYEVASRGGNTALTLTDVSSDNDQPALSTYSLKQYQYDLPSTFEALEGPLWFHPDEAQTKRTRPVKYQPWHTLRDLYQDSSLDTSTNNEPAYFTIYAAPILATAVQGYKLALFPTSDDVMHFSYRYSVTMSDLDGTNLYPPGGGPHSQTILEAILSEAEMLLGNNSGTHKMEFERCLATSIALDRQMSTAETVGRAPIKDPDVSQSYRGYWGDPNEFVIYPGTTEADYR